MAESFLKYLTCSPQNIERPGFYDQADPLVAVPRWIPAAARQRKKSSLHQQSKEHFVKECLVKWFWVWVKL